MPDRILIVDDSPTVRLATKNCLLRLGIEDEAIQMASTGEEALRLFPSFKPDLVFLDLVLPGMNGKRLATELFKINPTLKVVLMTGSKQSDPRISELLSMGVFDVVMKPVHLEKLEAILAQVARDDHGLHRVQ
ncbi:MAG TPA: response regulator [Candidatus Thermoplasmatota archaeon]|nr:response regulator [Candidatus Thermoplasmatota archaeon]